MIKGRKKCLIDEQEMKHYGETKRNKKIKKQLKKKKEEKRERTSYVG